MPIQRAIRGGETLRGLEMALRFPEGGQHFVLANAVPLRGADGRRQAICIFQDFTEHKRAQEALRASEERCRRIADSNIIGIAFWDMDGRITEANQGFLDLVGFSREDLRAGGLRWRDITPTEYRHLDDRALTEMRACGACRPFEKEYARKDGRRVPVLIGAALLEKSECEGVAFILDLTERKRAEEELKRLVVENAALYQQAAREAQVKDLLLGELNHRVRNNLALMVSFLELQRETPEGRQAAAVLDDAIARVQGLALVHNVLAGTGFEAGEYGALVRGLAEQTLLEGPLAGRATFRVEGPPLRLPSAQLTALGLITNELFTNIAKHAFRDGRTGTVRVALETAGRHVTIRVQDDGVGLPSGFTRQPGHLGLELIQSLAEVSLKGTFALESGEGTTAVIRFRLPG